MHGGKASLASRGDARSVARHDGSLSLTKLYAGRQVEGKGQDH